MLKAIAQGPTRNEFPFQTRMAGDLKLHSEASGFEPVPGNDGGANSNVQPHWKVLVLNAEFGPASADESTEAMVKEIAGGQLNAGPKVPVGARMPDSGRPTAKKFRLVKGMVIVTDRESGTNANGG
jgi:hypothetical protein